MPTYNTIMSIAAGGALISFVRFAGALRREKDVHLESWALAFAVTGFILTVTGIHMSLTWPMAKYFPFDNIIFGETSFGFGVLLLALAFYLWQRSAVILASGAPTEIARVKDLRRNVDARLSPPRRQRRIPTQGNGPGFFSGITAASALKYPL